MLESLMNQPRLSLSDRENHTIMYSERISSSFTTKTEYAGEIIIGVVPSYADIDGVAVAQRAVSQQKTGHAVERFQVGKDV